MANFSRRDFLRAGAGGLAAAFALPGLSLGQTASFNGFKVGAQSYTFRKFKLDQAVKKIADAGLQYVEFYRGHVRRVSTSAHATASSGTQSAPSRA